MTSTKSAEVISPLRRRMIEDMSIRKFSDKTRHDYIRHIETFAKFLGHLDQPAYAAAQLRHPSSGEPRTIANGAPNAAVGLLRVALWDTLHTRGPQFTHLKCRGTMSGARKS